MANAPPHSGHRTGLSLPTGKRIVSCLSQKEKKSTLRSDIIDNVLDSQLTSRRGIRYSRRYVHGPNGEGERGLWWSESRFSRVWRCIFECGGAYRRSPGCCVLAPLTPQDVVGWLDPFLTLCCLLCGLVYVPKGENRKLSPSTLPVTLRDV
jgi:hypothetical protein